METGICFFSTGKMGFIALGLGFNHWEWDGQFKKWEWDFSSKSRFSTWRFCSREQAKSECDWLVMSSVFVASQSSCFFLYSREQIRQVEASPL